MPVLIILLFLGFALLAYRSPKYTLLLLVALLPAYGVRFAIWGAPSTALEVIIWGTSVGWFAGQWARHGRPRLAYVRSALVPGNPFQPYLWPILLWLLVASASVILSPVPVTALGIWKAYFIEPLMVFAMVVLTFKNQKERTLLVWALGATTVAMASFAWYQHFTGLALPEPWATNRPLRVTAWFSYPNAVGLYLAPVIAMYMAWVMRDIIERSFRPTSFLLKLVVIILSLGAIVFSVTKGAWVGVAAAFFVAALLVFKKHWKAVLAIGVALTTLVLLVAPLRVRLLDEFLLRSPSGQIRRVVWEETTALLKDSPLAGAGLAGYQTALVPYHEPWHKEVSPYALEIFLYPHNVFLNFWVELGLGGLLVFLWLLVAFFREAWRKREQTLSVMAVVAMAALLVHGLVDAPYFKNDLAVLFWLIMALPLLEPTLHVAHRDAQWFDLMAGGRKTVEARLNDQKRRQYRVGDQVQLRRRSDEQTMLVEITALHHAPTFLEMLEVVSYDDLGFVSKERGLAEIGKYYTAEDENQHGVVGIRVHIIRLPEPKTS